MKKNKITSIIVQVGIIGLFVGGFIYLQQTQLSPTEVYTFSREIPVNTIIQEGDLKKEHIPKDGVKSNFAVDKNEIVGKAVTTKVFPGQYVVTPQLINPEDSDAFEKMDLSNYRKVTLPVDMIKSIGGNIKKGDRVDLQFTGKAKPTNGTGSSETIYAKTFMQDIIVYNVIDEGGKKFIDQTEGNSILVNDNGEVVESGALSVVTLAVTPEQADEIGARLQAGSVNIIGRFEDSVNGGSNGYTIGENGILPASGTNPER